MASWAGAEAGLAWSGPRQHGNRQASFGAIACQTSTATYLLQCWARPLLRHPGRYGLSPSGRPRASVRGRAGARPARGRTLPTALAATGFPGPQRARPSELVWGMLPQTSLLARYQVSLSRGEKPPAASHQEAEVAGESP